MIDLVAVDEHDQVRILLDGARFTKIRVDRALVGPLFQASVELGERHYRALQLFRQRLERAGDFTDLQRTVVGEAGHPHQLQVVHHDHADAAVVPRHPAGTRAHFGRGKAGGVVDIHLALLEQQSHGGRETSPVLVVELTGPHLGLVDAPHRGEHTHDDLLGRHLQREDEHRLVGGEGRVLAQVHGKGRLAHGGTGRDDDQIRALQAGGHLVQIVVAAGDAGHPVVRGLEQLFNLVDGLLQDELEGLGALVGTGALLGDLEHLALGKIQQIVGGTSLGLVARFDYLVGDRDHLPHHRALTHDFGVGVDVGGTRGVLGDLHQIGEATGLFELLGALQLLLQGDEVDGVARIGEAGHGLEDQTVRAAVEILVDHPFGDPIPGLVVQHQAAQYGLFGLKRVGRYFQLLCLGVFFRRHLLCHTHKNRSGKGTGILQKKARHGEPYSGLFTPS